MRPAGLSHRETAMEHREPTKSLVVGKTESFVVGETPEHYRGKMTIDKQEAIVEGLVWRGMTYQEAFDAATAIKYTDRAGDKEGEGFDRDLGKACDYLYRATNGVWPWE